MSNPPIIFVIVTAGNCGGCSVFKSKHRVPLLKKLRSSNRIRVVEISVPTTVTPLPDKYHPDLKNKCRWFPYFALFSAASWNDRNAKLDGVIFGALFNKDGEMYFDDKFNYPMTTDGINTWIKNNLKNPIFLRTKPLGNVALTPKLRDTYFRPYPPDFEVPEEY